MALSYLFTKLNLCSIAIWLCLFQLIACNSQEQKKDKVISAQEKQIKDLEERINKIETEKPSSYKNVSDNQPTHTNSQYYFILLKVKEQHGLILQSLNYSSEVTEITNYNESIKYKLLDNAVSNYKSSMGAAVYNGSIYSREIFLFDTYEAASKEREKYIMR